MSDTVSIEGPVELINGRLVLRIPLAAGGDKLAPLAKGIGTVDHNHLILTIQPWLAEKLRIALGSLVVVDNVNGKFTVTRSASNDDPVQ
jgi:hypothetical protein